MKHLDFILWDVIGLHLAYVAAYFIRYSTGSPYQDQDYLSMAVVLTVVDILVAVLFDTMHNILQRDRWMELASMVKHAILVFALLAVYLFSVKMGSEYSRITMYLTFGFHMLFGYGLRQFWKWVVVKKGVRLIKRSLLLVADEENIQEVLSNLQTAAQPNSTITGIVLADTDAVGSEIQGIPVVAALEDAAEYICREWVDQVLIATEKEVDQVAVLGMQCQEMGVAVHRILTQKLPVGQRQFVEKLGSYTVLTSSINYANPIHPLLKRCMDIAGALVGCMFTGLIVLIIGPIIYKASPGPIFFTQERVGQNGRRFKLLKIRSMYLDAEERKQELMSQNRVSDGMMFKLDFDPRIIGNKVLPDGTKKTGIGEFIRKTSLDEFPQFINVLKGDMSLVGTRPPTLDEWEKYKLHHRARLAMKPGITGMWQVSGRSNMTDFEEVVKLDTQYITGWSLGLDMRILCKTVLAVFHKDGAM